MQRWGQMEATTITTKRTGAVPLPASARAVLRRRLGAESSAALAAELEISRETLMRAALGLAIRKGNVAYLIRALGLETAGDR
jgi:hypothetical protein